jgi:hypothetical protein
MRSRCLGAFEFGEVETVTVAVRVEYYTGKDGVDEMITKILDGR